MYYACSTYLESFVEANDIGVTQGSHDARLAVQVSANILVLYLPRVDYLDRHLQHTHDDQLQILRAWECVHF